MKSLTARTIESLRALATEASLEGGSKLPTLAELAGRLRVSRTVIREAVAALRTEGVIEARHGVGIFVRDGAAVPRADAESAALDSFSRLSLPFMDVLELRMAFEVHAAGLAARRRSWAQEDRLWEALRHFETAIESGEGLDDHDFAFHQTVAEATNNLAFIEFFNAMSRKILPRQTFSRDLHPSLITDAYIQNTVVEHRAIAEAVSAGDAAQARQAMQAHLDRSHRRYRGFETVPAERAPS